MQRFDEQLLMSTLVFAFPFISWTSFTWTLKQSIRLFLFLLREKPSTNNSHGRLAKICYSYFLFSVYSAVVCVCSLVLSTLYSIPYPHVNTSFFPELLVLDPEENLKYLITWFNSAKHRREENQTRICTSDLDKQGTTLFEHIINS